MMVAKKDPIALLRELSAAMQSLAAMSAEGSEMIVGFLDDSKLSTPQMEKALGELLNEMWPKMPAMGKLLQRMGSIAREIIEKAAEDKPCGP